MFPPHFTAPLRARIPRSTKEQQTTQAKDFKVRLTYIFSPKHCQGVKGLIQPVNCNQLLVPPGFTTVYKYRTAILFKTKYYIAGKKRPAWDYKGRLEDMETFLLKSNSCMEDMTKTIGDNQGRITYLESLNKQLEGTVQVKNQQSEQVRSVSIAIPRSWRGPDPYRSRIPASFARQSRVPNFCHLCPEYRFLSQYRLQCQDFGESNFPRSGQIPFPVKKFCAFPNPVLYFGHRVIKRSRKCQEESYSWVLGKNALFTVIYSNLPTQKRNKL